MPYGPKRMELAGVELVDVRDMFPTGEPAGRLRNSLHLEGVAVHHDGAMMRPGDRNYSGSTLDEDMARLAAIYHRGLDQGWGGMPYQIVVSPHGRTFYTLNVVKMGAHVARRNHLLVGLALMGDFTAEEPGDLQLCAAARGLIAIWRRLDELLPFQGHRELALPGHGTECPGDTWWSWQHRLVVVTRALERVLFA